MAHRYSIALMGTGLMGYPMAENILAAGYGLTVWNRSLGKAQPLAALGAAVAESAADAVTGADIIITMLSDGAATGTMISNRAIQDNLKQDAIWVDMSSIAPDEARAQSAVLQAIGVHHLDAPVSGGTKGAEAASLAIMAGGNGAIFERTKPVLEAMGRATYVGPSGAGQLSKLANQAIVAITIGAVAEAMLLVEKGGADPVAVRQALKGGFADSVILQQHGKRMTDNNFEPGGLCRSQLKDLDNTLQQARDAGIVLPTTQHIRDRYITLVDQMGCGDKDHSGLYLELKHQNGLN